MDLGSCFEQTKPIMEGWRGAGACMWWPLCLCLQEGSRVVWMLLFTQISLFPHFNSVCIPSPWIGATCIKGGSSLLIKPPESPFKTHSETTLSPGWRQAQPSWRAGGEEECHWQSEGLKCQMGAATSLFHFFFFLLLIFKINYTASEYGTQFRIIYSLLLRVGAGAGAQWDTCMNAKALDLSPSASEEREEEIKEGGKEDFKRHTQRLARQLSQSSPEHVNTRTRVQVPSTCIRCQASCSRAHSNSSPGDRQKEQGHPWGSLDQSSWTGDLQVQWENPCHLRVNKWRHLTWTSVLYMHVHICAHTHEHVPRRMNMSTHT